MRMDGINPEMPSKQISKEIIVLRLVHSLIATALNVAVLEVVLVMTGQIHQDEILPYKNHFTIVGKASMD